MRTKLLSWKLAWISSRSSFGYRHGMGELARGSLDRGPKLGATAAAGAEGHACYQSAIRTYASTVWGTRRVPATRLRGRAIGPGSGRLAPPMAARLAELEDPVAAQHRRRVHAESAKPYAAFKEQSSPMPRPEALLRGSYAVGVRERRLRTSVATVCGESFAATLAML